MLPSCFFFLCLEFQGPRPHLVLASCCLTRLELVQVPPTNGQATLILVHALAEALHIVCAGSRLGHLSGCLAGRLVLCSKFSVLGRGIGGSRGTATKPSANRMAN